MHRDVVVAVVCIGLGIAGTLWFESVASVPNETIAIPVGEPIDGTAPVVGNEDEVSEASPTQTHDAEVTAPTNESAESSVDASLAEDAEADWLLRLLASLPTYSRVEGTERVAGVAQEPDGRPVEGVTVRLVPRLPRHMEPAADIPHAALTTALMADRWGRANELTATSGADGRFVIDSVQADTQYRVHHSHPEYDCPYSVQGQYLNLGEELDLPCIPLAEFQVYAYFPDGTEATECALHYSRGPGWDMTQRTGLFPLSEVLRYYTGAEYWVESLDGAWASERTTLPIVAERPIPPVSLTFQLQPAAQPTEVLITYRRVPGGVQPDRCYRGVIAVPTSEPLTTEAVRNLLPRELFGRDLIFNGDGIGQGRERDLVPGRYAAFAVWVSNAHPVIGWSEFYVASETQGTIEVDVEVTGIPREDLLFVRFTQEVPQRLDRDLDVRAILISDERDRSWRLWSLHIEEDVRAIYIEPGSLPARDAVLRLIIGFGFQNIAAQLLEYPVDAIPAEATIHLPAAVPFILRLREVPAGMVRENIYYSLSNEIENVIPNMRLRGEDTTIAGLPAGAYRLRLFLAIDHPGVQIYDEAIDINERDQVVTVSLPPLYRLTLRFPPDHADDRLVLEQMDAAGEMIGTVRITIANNQADFSHLPMGTYRVRPDVWRAEPIMAFELTGDAQFDVVFD